MTSISSGTHRPQDLIPAFQDALLDRDPVVYTAMFIDPPFSRPPAYVYDEGDDSEWWSSEDCAALLEELFEALEDCAPEGHYFGAHPGDGAHFGYWEVEHRQATDEGAIS